MKTLLASLFLLPAISLSSYATDANTALVQARQQRVQLLRTEIKAIDERIESRVDLLVTSLTGIVDSKESRSAISEVKKQTITELVNAVENYQRRRAAIIEEIRQPRMNLTQEQKESIAATFDERTEKRVAQILALQKSFPDSTETSDIATTRSGKYTSPYFAGKAQNAQNKRLTQQSDSLREKTTEALKNSIEQLESQNRSLQSRAKSYPAEAANINAGIARNDALIATRRKQLSETFTGSDAANTRAVSQSEAADINRLLTKASTELRADVNTLFQRYSELLPAIAEYNTAVAASSAKP